MRFCAWVGIVVFGLPVTVGAGYTFILNDGSRITSDFNFSCPEPTSANPLSRAGCQCTLTSTFETVNLAGLSVINNSPKNRTLLGFRVNTTALNAACNSGLPCGICPAGTHCANNRITVSGFNLDIAICTPCFFGQLCPEGSLNPFSQRLINICPAGQLCPDPTHAIACPAGSFCAQTSFQNLSCTKEFQGQRLGFDGNSCPINSSHPLDPCPAGFYCPTSDQLIICPSGYYCPEQSIAPRRCWALSSCGKGSKAPPFSWLGFIISVAGLGFFFLAGLLFQRRWRTRQQQLREEEQQRDKLLKLKNALFKGITEVAPDLGFTKSACPITFEFIDLGVSTGKKQIIAGITGKFAPGRLTAVLGPSGSGKSTFIKALSGRAFYGVTQGKILVNGVEDGVNLVEKELGFVPQDDVVHTKLTVRENLMYSARLRLDVSVSASQRENIIDGVMRLLRLSHVADTTVAGRTVRGISGGELKRVNVGMELVANPTAVFVDEATSGLDSATAAEVVSAFSLLCKEYGKTIAMVIHQPRYSIFELFDDVLLIGQQGKTVYYGPTTSATPYFDLMGFKLPALENPADYYMDVIGGNISGSKKVRTEKDLYEHWQSHGFDFVQQHHAESTRASRVASSAPSPNVLSGSSLKAVNDLMRELDPKNIGSISLASLSGVMSKLKQDINPSDLEALLASLDTDKSGVVDKGDFLKLLEGNSAGNHVTLRQISDTASESNATAIEMEGLSSRVPKPLPPKRKLPNTWVQFVIFSHRSMVKWWRTKKSRLIDMSLILASAFILGGLQGSSTSILRAADQYLLAHLAVGLLTCVASLHIFTSTRVIYWREAAVGIDRLAYYLAKITVDLGDVFLRTLLFAAIYYGITQPNAQFGDFLFVLFLLSWCWSGMGYFISLLISPNRALVAAVAVPLISGGFFTGVNPQLRKYRSDNNYVMQVILCASPNRWSIEAATIKETEGVPANFETLAAGLLDFLGYRDDFYGPDMLILFSFGILFRIVSYFVMTEHNKGVQKIQIVREKPQNRK